MSDHPTRSGSGDTVGRYPAADARTAPLRTAILLPPGCLFSRANPNSMETVVRTLDGAHERGETRIFCCEGASDHDAHDVEALPITTNRHQALIDSLRRFAPDVVEHHQQVKRALVIAANLPQAAHLLYRHNGLKPAKNRFDTWRYQARYARMDGLVFVSEAERAFFARAYPKLADKAWAVPNPIDAGPWLASPQSREPVIAFAGRAMPEKGVDLVCAALPGVLDRHPEWRAVLMLNDWEKHHHWAQPHVAPLERYGERVTILRSAPLAEVRRRMKTAAIALTPSVWDEPFGLAAVEANAAGAALISSGRGGLREASGPYALYLNEVTAPALAAAIERLICNPGERLQLAEAAQRYVLEQHSPQKRAGELSRIREHAFSHLVGSRRGRMSRGVTSHAITRSFGG